MVDDQSLEEEEQRERGYQTWPLGVVLRVLPSRITHVGIMYLMLMKASGPPNCSITCV